MTTYSAYTEYWERGGHFNVYTAPEPPEETCAYVEVWARNAKEAKRLAYHAMKETRDGREWISLCRGDDRSPFSGMKVEAWTAGPSIHEVKPSSLSHTLQHQTGWADEYCDYCEYGLG